MENETQETQPTRTVVDCDYIYRRTLISLQAEITNQYGSAALFCQANDISPFNLSRTFSGKTEGRKKDMSVGLYLRVCVALDLVPLAQIGPEPLNYDMSLRDYLALFVRTNPILNSLLILHYA